MEIKNRRAKISPYVYPSVPMYHKLSKEKLNLTVYEIIDVILDYYQVTMDDLLSPGRPQSIVKVRRMIYVFLIDKTKSNMVKVGKLMEKDRTSIYRFAKEFRAKIKSSPSLQYDMTMIDIALYKFAQRREETLSIEEPQNTEVCTHQELMAI